MNKFTNYCFNIKKLRSKRLLLRLPSHPSDLLRLASGFFCFKLPVWAPYGGGGDVLEQRSVA